MKPGNSAEKPLKYYQKTSQQTEADQKANREKTRNQLYGLHAQLVKGGKPENHIITMDEVVEANKRGDCDPFSTMSGRFYGQGLNDILQIIGLPYKGQQETETKKFTKPQILGWFNKLADESPFIPSMADIERAQKEGELPNSGLIQTITGSGVRSLLNNAKARYQLRQYS